MRPLAHEGHPLADLPFREHLHFSPLLAPEAAQHPVDQSWLDESLVFRPKEHTWKFLTGDELKAAKETWGRGSHGGNKYAMCGIVCAYVLLFCVVFIAALVYMYKTKPKCDVQFDKEVRTYLSRITLVWK